MIVDISTLLKNINIDIDIDKAFLKNIGIDKEILENIDIDIDIDKEISENIDIDKISNRLEFGISNSPRGWWSTSLGSLIMGRYRQIQTYTDTDR